MKVGFDVKFGHNEIDIPIEEYISKFGSGSTSALKDKFTKKVTIYNDIPSDGVNLRRFDRFVIDKCLIYNQLSEGSDGTIQKIINSQNVITKDTEHYKSPIEYKALAEDERDVFYTVQVDDFVVLDEVDDVVTTGKEFQNLQSKYKGNGFLVTSVNANIFGIGVDNVQITHA